MRLWIACLALPALLLAKSPITHEAIWLMKRVGAPVVSPDGKHVVMSVTEPAYDEKDQASDLWIAPTDASSQPRRLTFTKGGESGVTWSPDSRSIVFSAKREGDDAIQLYIMNVVDGGESRRLTSISTGAGGAKFSPDGKRLLFVSNVYPGTATDEDNKKIASERKARKYNARVYEGFPIRYWDRWLDDTQAHVFVMDAQDGAKPKDILAGTQLVQSPGFAGSSSDTGQDLSPVWTPDSQSIVFVATTVFNKAAYAATPTHLYVMPASGGEPKALTSGEDSYSRPRFRPDGKALYAAVEPHSQYVFNQDRLVMFSWPNPGDRTIVAPKFDRAPGAFGFSPDSRTIYLTAEDAGHEKIYTIPASGGDAKLAFELSEGVYTNLNVPEKASAPLLIATWESSTHPGEVVRIDAATGRNTSITSFNTAKAADLDWAPLRHFTFTAKNGKRIHSMLVLPQGFDASKKYPLIVMMHGGPHTMWRDQFFLRWNYHLIASPGYVLLLTNYTGSTGFGEKFAQQIMLDPLKGPGEEINEAADYAIKNYTYIDGSRQAAAGASYGGHLANWMQAVTTRYKCLVSHAGLINLESQWGTSDTIYHRELNNGGPVWEQGKTWREQNPIRYAARFKTPMLLSVGERDFRVPMNQTLENWSVLKRLQIPSKLIVWPEENHWIMKSEDSRFFYSELLAWFKKYLG